MSFIGTYFSFIDDDNRNIYVLAKSLFYMFKESFSNRCKGLIAVPYNVYFVFKLWRKGPEYKAASLRGVNKMVVGQKVSKTFAGKD